MIHGFADGCPLESASGLQVGDRILSIDGERIYTFSDVSLLLGRNKTGDFDLMTTGMNASAIKARWENKKKVPGIGETQIVKLSLTKVK